MKYRTHIVALALMSAIALPALAEPSAPTGGTATPAARQADAASAHEHFEASLKAFGEKNYQRAAADIRHGAAAVEQAAEHASGEAGAALKASALELKGLAVEVERGTVGAADRLESAFARAEHALGSRAHWSAAAGSPFDYGA
jgi:hypothetical protein